MNGSYDPYPDFSPLYEPTSFSWWLFSFPSLVTATSGGTDSSGCHNDNKGDTGYHCHNSTATPPVTTITNPGIVTESNTPATIKPSYFVPTRNSAVLRDNIQPLQSTYKIDRTNLECIYTSSAIYSADLVLSNAGFSVKKLKQVGECPAFSAKYSFLTNILTIFDISANSDSYTASLELNTYGKFNLFSVQKKGENTQPTLIYHRDDWGKYWGDEDHDCQDTRSEVLTASNRYQQVFSCTLSTGLWIDPYTQFEFYNANDLDIDHIVPLAYAHKHGGAYWSAALKNQFYNDIENLLPVSASSNRSKGSRSPAEWMPDNLSYRCQYVDSFLYIVDKYHLDLSDTERSNINKQCS